ncbi:Uncharacterised protein [Pragia fontium]|uniref:T6SS immunity protein Tli3 family protein n=1 Tax=Pragia fontium TaxID=82985 RepID=UPI000DFBFCF7|nr:hypothetical protein [Pragia fontium]SUB81667.1 Uncharacterised protein [Pragia fontium]
MTKVNLFIKAVLLVAMIIAVVFLFNKGIDYYLDWQQDVKKAQVAAEKAKKQAFAVKLVYVIDRNRYFTMFASEGRCEQGGEFWYHDITRGIHSRVGQGKTSYDYFFTDGEQHLGFPTARRDLQASAPFYYSNDFGQTWEPRTFDGNNTVNIFTQGKRVSAREKELDKDRQMAGVRTPSGWNKMMCLDVSMMVADKQGQRVYDDRKIEKLLYKIDNERYFSYLSDGESCNTNGDIFYNDSKNNIRSRLGYFNALRNGFTSKKITMSGSNFYALPLSEYYRGNDRSLYTSYDSGKHWQFQSTPIFQLPIIDRVISYDGVFFILYSLDNNYAKEEAESTKLLIGDDSVKLLGIYSDVSSQPIFKNAGYIYADTERNILYRLIEINDKKELKKINSIRFDDIMNAQTPSGWTETQCKPLSALKE